MKTSLILLLLAAFGAQESEYAQYIKSKPVKCVECKKCHIPEPDTIVLLGLGSLTLLWRKKK